MAIYLRPQSLTSALTALSQDLVLQDHDAAERLSVLAGATDCYPAATTRQAWFQPNPQKILDLSGISELRGLRQDHTGMWIGALTTWTDLLEAPLPPAFAALKQAARQVGGVQIQNRGTLVGNICNASPAADGVPPLLALDARVEIASLSATRQMHLSAFILGNRKTALRPGEIVSAVHIPAPQLHEKSVFLKLGARHYLVISIASVAANIVLDKEDHIASARIVAGACSAVPQRLHALENDLAGCPSRQASAAVTAAHLAGLDPIDDIRASASYRRQAATVLVKRALDQLATSQEQHGLAGSEA
jgi:CO/xanthine dehydrogenase FAD-binding subunit